MSDRPSLPPTGSHEVGYGKPPKATRFKKGQSGNSRGRPKGAKNKVPVAYERLKSILLSEAYREVEIQDKSGLVSIPIAQAVLRSLGLKAAKGHIEAQKLLLRTLSAVEGAELRERLKYFDSARAYQKKMRSVIQSHRDRGEDPPEILPHPDDIELDLETAEVIFHGPVSPADKAVWDRLHANKKRCEEEIDDLKAEIRLLEERESALLPADEFGEAFTVDDCIAGLEKDLEIERYFLMLTCLSIMRRWSLAGKKVTSHFVLQGLLDQHIVNGTKPKRPRSLKSRKIDWEKMYEMIG